MLTPSRMGLPGIVEEFDFPKKGRSTAGNTARAGKITRQTSQLAQTMEGRTDR